ncbi:SDR family NAD(P)-dependent oxidoreductase [Cohnella rhizosphaerae]|uniref:SDR family oxidoreductase n=1 Tax=Cohnella rhizosphaerae TaxID=1457232 RepID=A0A9X4QR39_9BACL|nr:SDR family oxidoreductase [Cohnella rhizosphaerae]MDG0808195.1 SDR family oxidoreductase [Cohnella rhizosphaerae]
MEGRLKDKVIAVTGGTKGIGKGIVEMAVREGAKVAFGGRSASEGEALASRLSAEYGDRICFVQGDIAETEACRLFIDRTVNRFGRIDGLVNNAGWFPRATLLETDDALFDQVFDVNMKSAFFCSRFAIEHMLKSGGGSIVHMGSTHGFGGMDDLAAYGCAKGAMHTLSKHIARNYAAQRIRSNWVTVGWVATEGEVARVEKDGSSAQDLEALGKSEVPSGRLQTVEDMAYGVIYLLADESSQVTGTDLHITGGFNI